jgi:hypothetical protein
MGSNFLFPLSFELAFFSVGGLLISFPPVAGDFGEVPAVEDHKGVPEVEDVGEVPGVGDGEEVPEDGCGSGSRRRDVEEVPEDDFESIVGVVEVVSVFFFGFP